MKQLWWLLKRLTLAAAFFTLLAFALNNLHEGNVYFFFGTNWRAPQVIIVLASFATGVCVGTLAMVPRWWRQRRVARSARADNVTPVDITVAAAAPSDTTPHGV